MVVTEYEIDHQTSLASRLSMRSCNDCRNHLSESVGVAIIPIAAILILAGNNIDELFSDI